MLHNKLPVAVVDNVEVPQSFATVTTGTETSAGSVIVTLFVVAVNSSASLTVTV